MDIANHALAKSAASQFPTILVSHRVDAELLALRNIKFRRVTRPLGLNVLGEVFLTRAATQYARTMGNKATRVVTNGGNSFWPGSICWVHYVHAAHEPTPMVGVLRKLKSFVQHKKALADEKRSMLSARHIVCNSDLTAKHVIERIGVDSKRVRTIYYGIDADKFSPKTDAVRQAIRTELGWKGSEPRFVFIGGLGDQRKGFDTLANAWKLLCSDGAWKGKLIVIGRGKQLPFWMEQMSKPELCNSVEFLGFRSDVPRILCAADALVSPTRYEAYGLGVHEAICCNLPAFVSRESGIAERYPAELESLLIDDPNNFTQLADQLRRWNTLRPQIHVPLERFSASLRSRSWETMAHEILSLPMSDSDLPKGIKSASV